jgi:hypothetical protein
MGGVAPLMLWRGEAPKAVKCRVGETELPLLLQWCLLRHLLVVFRNCWRCFSILPVGGRAMQSGMYSVSQEFVLQSCLVCVCVCVYIKKNVKIIWTFIELNHLHHK